MVFIHFLITCQTMKNPKLYGFGGYYEKGAEYSSGVGSNIYSNGRLYY